LALKVKLAKRGTPGKGRRGAPPSELRRLALKAGLLLAAVALVVGGGVFLIYYQSYEKIVDKRMRGPIFTNSSQIYAVPRVLHPGDRVTVRDLATQLRRAGYVEEGHGASPLGKYEISGNLVTIEPGPESYHASDPASVRIADGKVQLISAGNGTPLEAYELEPELITALADSAHRAKRRLVRYDEIPKVMVNAVLAIEDRRFFEHGGVNFARLFEAAWVDFRSGQKEQGASTITMQLSRGFFLSPEKTIKRKLIEMMIAFQLEQKFSKEQLFELYANEVYMGQRGSFTINGFGEAAQAYFGKDIQNLNLPEAALLAGLVQRPNYLSPYKNPERAMARRNLVLDAMVETGAITAEQAEKAKATPLKLAPPNVEASDAPYFVDLVKDQLSSRFNEQDLDSRGYRIYTTLDPDLQRAAAAAVASGIKNIDEQVQRLRTRRVRVGKGKDAKWETKVLPGAPAQVALVCVDPHNGRVLALVGGRNYGQSQLDHAVASRPTGSVFKPFVYATAINSALTDSDPVVTPATLIDDAPTTFTFGDQIYEPRNYKNEYHGMVTARYALQMSLNNATVKLAEAVGYDKVAQLARQAGITSVQPTPAMALGAYDATPLDVAGAYTVFANNGVRVSPLLVLSVRDARGDVLQDYKPDTRQVLDPRVVAVMTNMMEAVINHGTAAGVRARGFSAPAAGKTGTSHDGWFAGYTSNLLTVVWVGFDDYSDLRLSGASTAAPIWADFMKAAVSLPAYENVKPFAQPDGVVQVTLDKVTNRLATPSCPDDYTAEFIAGTEPNQTCDQAVAEQHPGFFQRFLGLGSKPSPPAAVSIGEPQAGNGPTASGGAQSPAAQPKKKKGIFGKILGIFQDDNSNQKPASEPPPPPPHRL